MAADMRAETGPGASGWARGSQTCSGTAPAFDPNPTTASTNAASAPRARGAGRRAAITAKDWLPAWLASSTSAKSNAAAPNWVITAYHWPACCTSPRCAVVGQDQEQRRHRHQLPEEQEGADGRRGRARAAGS